MSMSTLDLVKSCSITDYKPVVREKATPSWEWEQLFTVGNTNRAQEKFYKIAGLPQAQPRGELQAVPFYDFEELGDSTLTISKDMVGVRISREAMLDNQHIPALVRELGTMTKESLQYAIDLRAAEPFIYAFDSATFPMFDSTAMCANTHTLTDGSNYDNLETAATPDYDSVWSTLETYRWNLVAHNGLPMLNDDIACVVYHDSQITTWRKILENPDEPDTSDRNTSFVAKKKIKQVVCPHLTSTDDYFYLGKRAKKEFVWLWRERSGTDEEEDKQIQGMMFMGWHRSGLCVKDYLFVIGNAGS